MKASLLLSLACVSSGSSLDKMSLMQRQSAQALRPARSANSNSKPPQALVQDLKEHVENLIQTQEPGEPLSDAVMAALDAIMVSVQAIRDDLNTTHTSTSDVLHSLAVDFQSCLDTARDMWPKLIDDTTPLADEWETVISSKDEHHQCREQEVGHAREAIGHGACDTFLKAFPAKPEFTFTGLDDLMSGFDPDTFASKAKDCSAAVTNYKTSVPECKKKQHAFEDASCSFHKKFAKAHNTCVGIKKCRSIDGAELETSCASALTSAQAWNTAEGSLQQIECMLRKLKDSDFNTTEECNHETAQWDLYNITCPHVTAASSEEEQCAQALAMRRDGEEALVPSNDRWVQTMYQTQGWFATASNDAAAQGRISALVTDCDVPSLESADATTSTSSKKDEWISSNFPDRRCPQMILLDWWNAGCAVRDSDGQVVCWGDVVSAESLPKIEDFVNPIKIQMYRTGFQALCLIRRVDRHVKCWQGSTWFKNTGDTHPFKQNLPTDELVEEIGAAKDLVCDYHGCCATRESDEKAFCWGSTIDVFKYHQKESFQHDQEHGGFERIILGRSGALALLHDGTWRDYKYNSVKSTCVEYQQDDTYPVGEQFKDVLLSEGIPGCCFWKKDDSVECRGYAFLRYRGGVHEPGPVRGWTKSLDGACVELQDGTVKYWGRDYDLQRVHTPDGPAHCVETTAQVPAFVLEDGTYFGRGPSERGVRENILEELGNKIRISSEQC